MTIDATRGDPQLNKAQKLVQMVELMARRGGVRTSELMERFDLDARSLRRYLADLRDLDVPLRDDGRGDERLISVDPRWRRTGVQLSLAEVLSLHFGRKLFNFLEGTSFAEDLDGAIERLEPAISRAHHTLTKQLDTKFLAVPEPAKDYRRFWTTLSPRSCTTTRSRLGIGKQVGSKARNCCIRTRWRPSARACTCSRRTSRRTW